MQLIPGQKVELSQLLSNESISKLDLKKKVVLDKFEKVAPHLVDLIKKSLIGLEKIVY